MPLVVKNDEQIKVDTTTGLVAGSSSFTFDGTGGKPDFRNYDITVFEYGGRAPMIKGVDYTWNYATGLFTLLLGYLFQSNQWYLVQFKSIPSITPVSPANFIDWTYFIRDINIPNLSAASTNIAPVQKVNLFIEKYEPICLESILGYELYKALLTENSARIDSLMYGSEFTECGIVQKWKGLVYGNKISLIANYIYYYMCESDTTVKTGVNVTIPKGATLQPYSPEDRMIEAWRFFSKETKSMCSFLRNHKISGARVYPEFSSLQESITLNLSRPINSFGL